MFSNPSLVTRISIGKGIGLLVGLIGAILLTYIAPDTSVMFRAAIVLWYASVGAVIGVYGVFSWHPILNLPLPWYVRAPVIGAWLNFTLTLFIYDQLTQIMATVFEPDGLFQSPFWFVAEGAIVGLLIGFFATRFGGEGRQTIRDQP